MTKNNTLPLLLFSSFLLFCSIESSDTYFWNTDFEYEAYSGQPRKWAIETDGEEVEVALTEKEAQRGERSLGVHMINGEFYTYLPMKGYLIENKTLSISAFVKNNDSEELSFNFIVLNSGTPIPPMSTPQKINSTDWTSISYEYTFPDSVGDRQIYVAIHASGSGDFLLDNVSIRINGTIYGIDPPDFREPTPNEIDVLNELSHPIKAVQPIANTEDLLPLKRSIGNSTIVALGENSHGSRPIYEFKLRLFQYLVKEAGFRLFALESPTVETDYINTYVLTGEGSVNEVIKNLAYPSWKTQEMLDIIEWIREYNITAIEKVEFRGFDMQNGFLAIKSLISFGANHDAGLKELTDQVRPLFNKDQRNLEDRDALDSLANTIILNLVDKSHTDYTNVSQKEFSNTQHYATIFAQSLALEHQGAQSKSRDAYMADNIKWIQSDCGGCKMVISGDNDHIRKQDDKAGYYLSQQFGDSYYTVGFTFNKGTYTAYGPEHSYPVHAGYVGSYEYLFSKNSYDNFYLPLTSTSKLPLLKSSAPFRTIGSRPQINNQFSELSLVQNFDMMVFLKNSNHTEYLKAQ